jgi:putative hydrolase of the HAD superfamily
MQSPDLSHIDVWLFDLDHTLYPAECGLVPLVEARMNAYIQRELGLSEVDALALRDAYFHEHGATLAGLVHHHDIDPGPYIDEVHEVAMDCLTPDPELRAALERLPGRRLVFTNAGGDYARRALDKLAIADLFDDVFHLALAQFIPKPQRASFELMLAHHGVDPAVTCFFEDSERNLAPAADLGMTTVLVGPSALESQAAFVHHRTLTLPPFLAGVRVKQGL